MYLYSRKNTLVYVISFAQPAVIKMGPVEAATVCVVLTAPKTEALTIRVLRQLTRKTDSHIDESHLSLEPT